LRIYIYICTSYFFFSSRRRHTRCYRDWSSDVALPISDITKFRINGHNIIALRADNSLLGLRGELHQVLPSTGFLLIIAYCAVKRSEERRVGKECGFGCWTCRLSKEM